MVSKIFILSLSSQLQRSFSTVLYNSQNFTYINILGDTIGISVSEWYELILEGNQNAPPPPTALMTEIL